MTYCKVFGRKSGVTCFLFHIALSGHVNIHFKLALEYLESL